jgi:Protein kinase domain
MPSLGSLPTQIGRYKIVRRLGAGGMGTVFEAQDESLRRRVALKLPDAKKEDVELVTRFRREAEAAARIQHPNICTIYDVGDHHGIPYLVMALVEGRSLADFGHDGEALPLGKTLALVLRLAETLQEAHKQGVVHRDLKPANVLLNPRGEPVIVDFGMALLGDDVRTRMTKAGQPVGTYVYMAPEQARGDVKRMDHRCDVYGLGLILFELLTNRRAFDGTLFEILRDIEEVGVPPLRRLRPNLPKSLERVCTRATAKEIDHRYKAMTDFAVDLAPFVQDRRPDPAPAPRSPWPWLVGGQLAVLGSAAGVAALTDQLPALALAPAALMLAPAAALALVRSRSQAADLPPDPAADTSPPRAPDTDNAPRRRDAEPPAGGERQTLAAELAELRKKYERVTKWLAKSNLSHTYLQPVLVVGPRYVGKTSLVMQWHVPWDYSATDPTKAHRVCEVPVTKFDEKERVPH